MPQNVIECWLKCKNRYWIWFMGKCSLFRANECIFALLVRFHANECVFSRIMNSTRCILNKLENVNLKFETCLHGLTLEEASLSSKPSFFFFFFHEKLQTKAERQFQGLLRQTVCSIQWRDFLSNLFVFVNKFNFQKWQEVLKSSYK